MVGRAVRSAPTDAASASGTATVRAIAGIAIPESLIRNPTKAAVSALTRTAARDHIREGIRINVVSPGSHDTPMSLRPGENEAGRAARMKEQTPIGRVGSLDDMTATVLWLASEEAGYAVGHDLVLDGGASA